MKHDPTGAKRLIDKMLIETKSRSHNQLASAIGVCPGALSKYYRGIDGVGPAFILKCYDKSTLSIEEIRELLKNENIRTNTRRTVEGAAARIPRQRQIG